MPIAQIGNHRLHYEVTGESGTPVLLIMGFGVPGHLWGNQVPTLSAQHQVVWFDNAGMGNSAGQRPLWTLRAMAQTAVGLLDTLQWQDAHVVGVSMGGMIAQEIAVRHPSRVRSLSLLVTHAGGRVMQPLPSPSAIGLFLQGFLGRKRNRARALEKLVFPRDYLHSGEVDRELLISTLRSDVVTGASRRQRLAQLSALLRHDTSRRLGEVSAPTLVVKAGRDLLVLPKESDRLHRLIPESRLVTFPDAGHAIVHQYADDLNSLLLEHFAARDS